MSIDDLLASAERFMDDIPESEEYLDETTGEWVIFG